VSFASKWPSGASTATLLQKCNKYYAGRAFSFITQDVLI